MNKLPAIVVIIGSVMFLTAAFMPISFVYAERDVQTQIARVQGSPLAWVISLSLFALGSILVAAGLAWVTLHLHSTRAAFSCSLGLALITLGTLCWVVIAYTLLTQAALIAYGLAFLQAGYPRWLGLGAIIPAALLCVAYLIFKDMPPFVYYVITLVIGSRLLF